MTLQTLFTNGPWRSSSKNLRREQYRCILFDGNRNYPCDAYLQWRAWRPRWRHAQSRGGYTHKLLATAFVISTGETMRP
jgi:hypothetical protein